MVVVLMLMLFDLGIDVLMVCYDGQVFGVVVLVLYDGVLVFCCGYGLVVVEDVILVILCSNFWFVLVSKQFIVVVILLLVQDGMLILDDLVWCWLLFLLVVVDVVILCYLFSYISGLFDYEDLMLFGSIVQVYDVDVLCLFEGQNCILFVLGSIYCYSNSGYVLLVLVVGRVFGQDFVIFLCQCIFLLLGMVGMVVYQDGVDVVIDCVYGYSLVDGYWQCIDQSFISVVFGDGGFYFLFDDLVCWDVVLYDDCLFQVLWW